MELSSKVQNVVFGKTCRREAVKAAQRFDLRLLEYGCGGWREMKSEGTVPSDTTILAKKETEHLQGRTWG